MQGIDVPYTVSEIFSIQHNKQFTSLCLDAFKHQYRTNKIYKLFCNYLGVKGSDINNVFDIPFLPIELFKEHVIVSGNNPVTKIFKSSNTTGVKQSSHFVIDESIYQEVLMEGFKRVFGPPYNYSFLSLLPGYVERPDSSLIYMVNELMKVSKIKNNSFYIEASEDFRNTIKHNQKNNITTILFGVSFSLLEFALKNPISLKNVLVIETGGMKGKMKEKTRKELHSIFKKQFKVDKIYSEYGMTELLSQAYCFNKEEFTTPPWMQILIREPDDPKAYLGENKVGGINIIDLANINSCCFISTGDLGKKTSTNTFEVIGRFDSAEIRGCNLLFH